MSNTIEEPFCPLYESARTSEPWKDTPTAHTGLLFDKFSSAWRWNQEKARYEFDKGDKSIKENKQQEHEKKGHWLKKFVKDCNQNNCKSLIEEACQRQRDMVEKLGGEIIVLKNSSRFITGMGREHPLGNGFTWHHTLGVPFLPGSSLKGILRAWFRENEDKRVESLFGSQGNGVGKFICLDMLPVKPPKLVVEIMTPHYGPYYQDDTGKIAPGDWHKPVPIPFLAVEAGTSWQLAVIPGPSRRTIDKVDFDELITEIPEALSWLGAGAKTAVGYGRFEHDREREKEFEAEDAKRREETIKARERETQLSALSPQRRILEERAEKENWITDNSAFLQSVEKLLEENFEFDRECIAWIRDQLLEKRQGWKGIWDNPDAKKGKKKDKPKFNTRGANIVHKLKEILNSLSGNK